ncbi:MAG: TonB-dependent receptor plug domain-containing protein, partial [Methanosarcina sp.]
GNITTAARWNYLINNSIFSNLTLIYSRYRYRTNVENSDFLQIPVKDQIVKSSEDYRNRYISSIKDYGLKWDIENTSFSGHYLRGGLSNTVHDFNPGLTIFWDRGSASSKIDTAFGNRELLTNEFYVYGEDDFDLGSRMKVNAGIHYSGFYTSGKYYQSLEPRFSARYLVNENFSVKASYTRLTQYDHLLSNASIGLPTDLWVPSTNIVRPQKSWQISSGMECNFGDGYELTSEIYYKGMSDLIAYGDGASYFSTFSSWEEKVETGSGKSYGWEIVVQKTKGKFTGWIGYTLARSTRKFASISFGREFPYTYDRRHDLSVVMNYRFNDRIDLSGTWVLASGNMMTLSREKYMCMQGLNSMWLLRTGYFKRNEMTNDMGIVEHYDLRNNYRMPAYHRLDVGVNFRKTKKWCERILSLGAYNAYNRLNAFYLYYTYEENPAEEMVLYKVTLFPVIPYIRYNITF